MKIVLDDIADTMEKVKFVWYENVCLRWWRPAPKVSAALDQSQLYRRSLHLGLFRPWSGI